MLQFSQTVLDGLINGSIVALAALGITLIFSISRFANVAHGDLMTFGAYIALYVNKDLGGNLLVSTIAAILGTLLIGLVVYRTVFQPIEHRSSVALLISSIGVALILRNIIALIWGFDIQGYTVPIQRPERFMGLRATPTEIWIFVVSVGFTVGFFILLQTTRIGKEIRAVSDSPELAKITGISSHNVVRGVWMVALSSAALAGVLLGTKTFLTPNLGWDLLLPAFAATIVGGIGNPLGAVLGAFAVSVTQELSTFVIPANYKQMTAFVILILILLLRPSGLLVKRTRS